MTKCSVGTGMNISLPFQSTVSGCPQAVLSVSGARFLTHDVPWALPFSESLTDKHWHFPLEPPSLPPPASTSPDAALRGERVLELTKQVEADPQSHGVVRDNGVQSARLENLRLLCHMDASYGHKTREPRVHLLDMFYCTFTQIVTKIKQ